MAPASRADLSAAPGAGLFEAIAPAYDELFQAPHRRAYDELAWEHVRALLPAGPGLVVDAGCGTGRWLPRLVELGHRVVALEPSPAMAARVRERRLGERVTLVEAAIEDADLEPGGADLVIAMGSLQYTSDPVCAVHRLAGWARRGGAVCVLVDSLVALVLELLRDGREEEALDRLRRRRGVWRRGQEAAVLHLLDRASLEAAFLRAGLCDVRAAGLLVGASAHGVPALCERLGGGDRLALERRLALDGALADVGKQLLVSGRRAFAR